VGSLWPNQTCHLVAQPQVLGLCMHVAGCTGRYLCLCHVRHSTASVLYFNQIGHVFVRDTTASHKHVYREPMHVVEYHDDLFSWKKYSSFTYTLILNYLLWVMLKNVMKLLMCIQCSHFVGCWHCSVRSQMSWERTCMFLPLLLRLHYRPFGLQPGRLDPHIPGSRQFLNTVNHKIVKSMCGFMFQFHSRCNQ
jgi:hypothetical protein